MPVGVPILMHSRSSAELSAGVIDLISHYQMAYYVPSVTSTSYLPYRPYSTVGATYQRNVYHRNINVDGELEHGGLSKLLLVLASP